MTGDGHIAADDVVAVINYINAHPAKQDEAEALDAKPTAQSANPSLSADLLNLLATTWLFNPNGAVAIPRQ